CCVLLAARFRGVLIDVSVGKQKGKRAARDDWGSRIFTAFSSILSSIFMRLKQTLLNAFSSILSLIIQLTYFYSKP
ncbi:hypothetical protein ACJX0J_015073, partial [Zea mays]